jgi:hypothetical protein
MGSMNELRLTVAGYLCDHVALKFVPPLSEVTEPLCVPPDCIIVSVGLEFQVAEPFTSELLKSTVPKLASDRMPPEPVQHGASTITSADDRLADDSDALSGATSRRSSR